MAFRILLADDSMTAQKMGKDILAGAGYEVTAVSNGAAAAKKLADKPDIIILDVYMPGYTGLEICEKVRADMSTASTPVLLTVGKMEPWKPEDGQKVKADGVIIKPFEAQDLLAAVKKLEAKIAAAAAPKEEPAYEKTMIFKAPQVEEFKDDSYNEWKSDASSEVAEFEAPPPPPMEMSQEAASAPAFADMMMGDPTPVPAALDETATFTQPPIPVAPEVPMAMMDAPISMEAPVSMEAPISMETPISMEVPAPIEAPTEALKNAAAATGFDETVRYAHPVIQQVEPAPVLMEAAAAAPIQMEPANADPVPGNDPLVEFTSAPKAAGVKTTQAVDLEADEGTHDAPLAKDPSLVTDPTEISQFATKFGTEKDVDEAGAPIMAAEAAPIEEAAPAAVEETDAEFEARVAAAAAAFDQPVEETPAPVEAAPAPVEEAPKYERTMIMDASELAAIRKKVAEAQAAKEAAAAPAPEPIAEPAPVAEVEPISVLTPEPVAEVAPEPVMMAEPEPMPVIEAETPQSVPAGMADASLVEQMQAAVADMEVAAHEPEPEPIVMATPEVAPAPVAVNAVPEAPTSGGQDLELATALAAAVGGEAPAAVAAAASAGAAAGLETHQIAQAVHKVLERMLPNIVSEVHKEIDQLKK